jgi:putative Mn2+ efflux pump MntP
LRIAFAFGLFQAVMPVIGWLTGVKLQNVMQSYDHWIAFGLLLFIGAKMIYEAFVIEENEKKQNPLKLTVLLGLAIATSLDALAVGLSFAFLHVQIILPALIIGVITFFISFLGVYLGNKIGEKFGTKMEIIGGLILIGIGVRILIQHLLF